jgi:hypothetical protein
MSDKDKVFDMTAFLKWLQAMSDSLRGTNDSDYMYAAGAAKAYELTAELLKSGVFTKKETCL